MNLFNKQKKTVMGKPIDGQEVLRQGREREAGSANTIKDSETGEVLAEATSSESVEGNPSPMDEVEQQPETLQEAVDNISMISVEVKNFIFENDIDTEQIFNQLPEETDERILEMFMNPQLIETEDDAVQVYMALDFIKEELNLPLD